MASLLSRADALPSGLPSKFSCLTRLPRVKHFTIGALDRPELFEPVSAWPTFEPHVARGAVVNCETRERLKQLLTDPLGWEPLRLSDALTWQLRATREIDLETATRLGVTINRDLLNSLESDHRIKDEAQQLRTLLETCRFKSQAATWALAEDLVAASEEGDEALRAAFAPTESVLHRAYRGAALDLFRASRFRLKASSDLLAKWGCDADDEDRREAFLRYLIRGEHGFAVSEVVRFSRVGTWLDSVRQTVAFARFNGVDQNIILGRLGFAYVPPAEEAQAPVPPPTDEVKAFLIAVESWWSNANNRNHLVQRYLRYEYPNGQAPDSLG